MLDAGLLTSVQLCVRAMLVSQPMLFHYSRPIPDNSTSYLEVWRVFSLPWVYGFLEVRKSLTRMARMKRTLAPHASAGVARIFLRIREIRPIC